VSGGAWCQVSVMKMLAVPGRPSEVKILIGSPDMVRMIGIGRVSSL